MANQMLSVGGTIWDGAIPLNLAKLNPFERSGISRYRIAVTFRDRHGSSSMCDSMRGRISSA